MKDRIDRVLVGFRWAMNSTSKRENININGLDFATTKILLAQLKAVMKNQKAQAAALPLQARSILSTYIYASEVLVCYHIPMVGLSWSS